MNKLYVVCKYQDLEEDSILYVTSNKEKAEKVLEIEGECYAYVEEYQNTKTYTNQKDLTKLKNKIKELEKENERLNLFCMAQYGKTKEE